MSDHLDKFRSAMEAAGLTAPDEIHDDGKLVENRLKLTHCFHLKLTHPICA